MFNAKQTPDTPNGTRTFSLLNDTTNGLLRPKITSTPLQPREGLYATPPKPSLLSPKRYSLSEIATPPRTNRRGCHTMNHTVGGPLLGSSPYRVNVSTYVDAKSPGLASRAVQYSEEREKSPRPTHQKKYGSPGLFPIVHLFKKELPTLELKPKRVTVRIASPEYSRHNSHEHNRLLMEGIIKPNNTSRIHRGLSHPPSTSEQTNTRSVLDALKEISRKRIHATEEFDSEEESGKRLKAEHSNCRDSSNKRFREDSPTQDTPASQTTKKVCVWDAYAASCSSMDFSFVKKPIATPKRKVNTSNNTTLVENPKETKQVKLVSVETQTADSASKPTANTTTQTKSDDDADQSKPSGPPEVIKNMPLGGARKNRLAALIGTLTEKPEEADKSDTITKELPVVTAPPLVSILSDKTLVKPTQDKHVSFSLPEAEPKIATTPTVVKEKKLETPTKPVEEKKEPPIAKPPIELSFTTPKSDSISLVSSSSTSTTSMSSAPPSFSFGVVSPATSTKVVSTNILTKSPVSSPVQVPATKPTSPAGGFKFDLTSKPSSPAKSPFGALVTTAAIVSPISSTAPTFNFSSTPKTPELTSPINFAKSLNKDSPAGLFGKATEEPKPAINFGAKPTNSFAAPTTTAPPMFSFGSTTTVSTAVSSSAVSIVSTTPQFGAVVASTSSLSTSAPAPSMFSMPVTTSTSFGVPKTSATTSFTLPAPTTTKSEVGFSFGKTPVFAFGGGGAGGGTSAPVTTAAPTVAFGTTSAAPIFGAPSAPSTTTKAAFGTTNSAPPIFAAPTTTSKPITFGQSTGFGAVTTTTSSSTFGVTTTAVPMFGNNPVKSPQFNQTSNIFGGSATANTNNTFGGAATNNASTFGGGATNTNTTFGGAATNNASTFGGGAASNTSSTFGAATKPIFAATAGAALPPTTQPFATPSTNPPPSFGSTVASPNFSGFATPKTTSSFGAGTFPTTTTSSSLFGTNTTVPPAFGATNNTFGGTAAPSTGFGGGFGSSAAAPSFGSSFAAPAPTNNSFSFGQTSSGATSNNTFGAGGFGASAVPTTQSGVFSFGGGGAANATAQPPKPSGVFSFGGSETPKSSGFNFSAAGTSGGFGGGNMSFGAAAPPAAGFGQFSTPAGGGTFSIGAGPPSGSRGRAHLKAKRRT